MNEVEHRVERLADGVGERPAGHRLGHRVEEPHPPGGVGGEDAVADARQGDLQPLLLVAQLLLDLLAAGQLAHQGTQEQVAFEREVEIADEGQGEARGRHGFQSLR